MQVNRTIMLDVRFILPFFVLHFDVKLKALKYIYYIYGSAPCVCFNFKLKLAFRLIEQQC